MTVLARTSSNLNNQPTDRSEKVAVMSYLRASRHSREVVSTEAEEYPLLVAVTKQRPVMTVAD
jgi:hypothetical protein